MSSTNDYGDLVAGKLAARLASGTTSGATVTAQSVNGSVITWPTGAHRLKLYRKTKAGVEFETIGVASASQSGSTVTLGTLTRQMSMTDGSTFSSGGDGRTFPANTDVYLSWDVFDAEQTAKKDIANTFSAKQTFSVPKGGAVYANTGAFPAGSDGDEGAYSTADGQFYDKVGGSWQPRASGTNSNGSTTVAGKFEEATVAEQGSATATGGTGARLVPAVANLVKTSSGSGDENKIPLLNASGILANGFIATSGTANSSTVLLGDRTWGTPPAANYAKVVALNTTDSSTLGASSTSDFDFNNHQYTIPANDLINGVAYEIEATITLALAAGNIEIFGSLGSTKVLTLGDFVTPTSGPVLLRWTVFGTEAAGASVTVKASGEWTHIVSAASKGFILYSSTSSIASNGTLVLKMGGAFRTSNGSNSMIMRLSKITKLSTSAF